MISEFALFLFTTLCGLAAGTYAVCALCPQEGVQKRPWLVPGVSIALLAVSGVVLLLHLGRPEHVIYAFNNPASGITQEGLATAAFGVLVAVDLVFALMHKQAPHIVPVLAGVCGAVLAFVMGNAYFMMSGSPAWAAWPTIALFLVGTLSIGAAAVGALEPKLYEGRLKVVSVVLHAAFVVTLIAEAMHFAAVGQAVAPFVVATVLMAAATAGAALAAKRQNLAPAVFVLVVVALVVARYAFYAACILS